MEDSEECLNHRGTVAKLYRKILHKKQITKKSRTHLGRKPKWIHRKEKNIGPNLHNKTSWMYPIVDMENAFNSDMQTI